jgi:hypothetical protein
LAVVVVAAQIVILLSAEQLAAQGVVAVAVLAGLPVLPALAHLARGMQVEAVLQIIRHIEKAVAVAVLDKSAVLVVLLD